MDDNFQEIKIVKKKKKMLNTLFRNVSLLINNNPTCRSRTKISCLNITTHHLKSYIYFFMK